MKFKNLFLIGRAFLFAGFLGSCSQSEDTIADIDVNDDANLVEWSVDLKLPDDYKTRAAASGTVGSDGLYTFTREIDRLWYAVYYNGAYLYDSEQPGMPGGVKKNDGFTVLFKFHKDLDPTQIYIFFWAGNSEDNVTTTNATTSNSINLNFQNRCVSVNPLYMNGNNTALQEYDSFSGYIQLSPTQDVTEYNLKVVLKRPFAQIHILSDEFTFPGVAAAFPNGVIVTPGFGVEAATTSNYTDNIMSPTTWFFDSSINLTPAYKKNEFDYMTTTYEFTNYLRGNSPQRVTFKGRTMDYLGCYYVFAPIEKSPLKYAASTGNNSVLGKINLAFRKLGFNITTAEFATVEIPSDGIQANNRYVIYNHANTGDGDGGGGNGGFITGSWSFEVVKSPDWDATVEETI